MMMRPGMVGSARPDADYEEIKRHFNQVYESGEIDLATRNDLIKHYYDYRKSQPERELDFTGRLGQYIDKQSPNPVMRELAPADVMRGADAPMNAPEDLYPSQPPSIPRASRMAGRKGPQPPSDLGALQARVDEIWRKAPTDENGAMIEALARKYGITPPWTGSKPQSNGNPLIDLYGTAPQQPAPMSGQSPLNSLYGYTGE